MAATDKKNRHILNNYIFASALLPTKNTIAGFKYRELLSSKIGDIFDFEGTLPTSVRLSDNVIDCINLLKYDEQCHEGLLVRDRKKHVGIVTGRELIAALLATDTRHFAQQPIGNYFSPSFNAVTEDTSLLDFIQRVQRTRRGFGLVMRGKDLIGKISIRDVVSLYLKMDSDAMLSDFPLHKIISASPNTTIRESLMLMMKHQIRKIFIEEKSLPFVNERNILGLVSKCIEEGEYSTLDKPISECEKNYAVIVEEETVKNACKKILVSDTTCVLLDKRYVFTSWDLTMSFLVDRIHEYQKRLVASEKLAVMGELTARLNHELRNPLSIIKNSTDMLKMKLDKTLTEDHMEYFRAIERAIARITHQVDDVLDFARISDLRIDTTSVSETLDSALSKISIPKDIVILKNIQEHAVQCDKDKIAILIKNLVLNSIDAVAEKVGADKKITISIKKEHDLTILEIEDTGIGIPERDLGRIFEPLYTTKQRGIGFGLTICKFIARLHKGDIFVNSGVNSGTRVTIVLPTRPFGDK